MPAIKWPRNPAELDTLLKAARNEGFNAGTIASLAVVAVHDSPVIWHDIVRAAGPEELIKYAKKDQGSWSWAGFKAYARSEFGADFVKKCLATARSKDEFKGLSEDRRPGLQAMCKKVRSEYPAWGRERVINEAKARITEPRRAVSRGGVMEVI